MSLENFGSILNFAEDLEKQDNDYYLTVAANPKCSAHEEMFKSFAADSAKNRIFVQRVRRENVTEMILEAIRGLSRDSFCEACEGADSINIAQALETALRLEKRAYEFYLSAGEKLKALPEVAQAMKRLMKKRAAHIKQLEALL
jgi:rubrerythrin